MNRTPIIAFAVVGAILTLSAAPVSAASANLAVANQYTDFGTGDEPHPTTLQNTTLEGSGDSAVVEYSIEGADGFEDGALDGWTASGSEQANWDTTTSSPINGSYSAIHNSTLQGQAMLERGTIRNDEVTIRGWTRVNAFASGIVFSDDPEVTGIEFQVREKNDDIAIYDRGSGTVLDTSATTIDPDTPYYVSVVYQNGSATMYLDDDEAPQENPLAQASASISANGLSYGLFSDNGGYDGVNYFDEIRTGGTGTGDGTYISANHSVSSVEQVATDLSLSNVSATVEVQRWDGDSWTVDSSATYETSGNHTLNLSGADTAKWRTKITFESTGESAQASLSDETYLFDPDAPELTEIQPENGSIVDEATTLSVNLSDADFALAQSDSVTVEFLVDGSVVGSDTRSSNGSVSTTWTPSVGGEHTYQVRAADNYGENTTAPSEARTLLVPSELRIFNESRPNQLINDDVDLEVQFYPLDGGDAISRQANNGTVDLAGLPVDQRFVVTVTENSSDQWVYRRIVIDSIFETSRIYLLNKSVPHSQVVFELQDPTGQFPPEDTILYVEKAMSVNNTTNYRTIAGDTFGSTGRFPVVLQQENRYRLRVATTDGESERILGSYSVYGETLEPLQIQRIEPNSDKQPGDIVYGSVTKVDGNNSIAVRYRNLNGDGSEVTYRIREGTNGSVIVPNTTSSASKFAHIYPVNSSGAATYTVEYWVTTENGTASGSFPVGKVPEIASRIPIDSQVLSIVSWIAILSTMGLLVIVDTKLAPIGGVAVASALVIMGTVAIPAPILGMAGAVSVLTAFGGDA